MTLIITGSFNLFLIRCRIVKVPGTTSKYYVLYGAGDRVFFSGSGKKCQGPGSSSTMLVLALKLLALGYEPNNTGVKDDGFDDLSDKTVPVPDQE